MELAAWRQGVGRAECELRPRLGSRQLERTKPRPAHLRQTVGRFGPRKVQVGKKDSWASG